MSLGTNKSALLVSFWLIRPKLRSNDGLHAALLSKHNIYLVTKQLQQVSTLHGKLNFGGADHD